MPLIAEAAKGGLPVSLITQELLIVLMLGAGTDYGPFLAFRVREELSRGAAPHQAVIGALTRVGQTITYSAITVAAALLSLLLASFSQYRGLGPALAIGLGVMLLASLTLTPALFALCGRAAFWPRPPGPAGGQAAGAWRTVAAGIVRHPVRALAADEALFRYAAPVWDSPAVLVQAQHDLAAAPVFSSVTGPGTLLSEAHLTGEQLAGLHAELGPAAALPAMPPPGSTVPAQLYQLYRATAQFISPDGHTIQYYVTMRAGPPGSVAAVTAVPHARAAVTATARTTGAQASGLAGQDATSYDINSASDSSLLRVIPVVLAIIVVLLALLLRSLVPPWYLVATVGLSYLASLGFAMTVFVHLGNQQGVNFVLPFLMFVFAMALGEDYNILVMSRIREEAGHTASLRQAITRAIGITGKTVSSAGIVLAGTFVVLGIVGGNSQAQEIGFAVAFSVFLVTFFVQTLLNPSIAVLLGPWNWWPSRLSRQQTTAPAGSSGQASSAAPPPPPSTARRRGN
jgi:putative drug exporter of the RND superfamily